MLNQPTEESVLIQQVAQFVADTWALWILTNLPGNLNTFGAGNYSEAESWYLDLPNSTLTKQKLADFRHYLKKYIAKRLESKGTTTTIELSASKKLDIDLKWLCEISSIDPELLPKRAAMTIYFGMLNLPQHISYQAPDGQGYIHKITRQIEPGVEL